MSAVPERPRGHGRRARAYRRGRPVLLLGAAGSAVLAAVKIGVGLAGHSQALVADGVHAAVDVAAVGAAWIGLFVSRQPADEAHPYGHQKAETVAAMAVAVLLILAGFQVLVEAVGEIARGRVEAPIAAALWVGAASVAVKAGLLAVTARAASRTRSEALSAAAADHRADMLSGLVAAAGIAVARAHVPLADPVAAVLVSGLVLHTGWRLVVDAVDRLMDRFDDQAFLTAVERTVESVEGVEGVAGLRGRPMGTDVLLDLEILVAGQLTVEEGHEIARRVRRAVERAHPRVIGVHVHVNPWPEGPEAGDPEGER
jgi:cation diffusion facilitator family transporter